jgi:hypothetical protein
MTETPVRTHEQSIIIEATPEALYDLVSDITHTGEWSPVCTACWWDDAGKAGQVGVWFTGHNELPERTWETRSQIAAADRGRDSPGSWPAASRGGASPSTPKARRRS